MAEPSENREGKWEMVMPFVAVRSQGGHYDDESYVAGWEMGALEARLGAAKHFKVEPPRVVLHPENVPQADLLAMRVGAKMIVNPWPDDLDPVIAAEWTDVSFEWVYDDA